VFIGNPVTHARAYTPPATREVIVKLLDNWSVFVNGSDNLDPIVRMAVAHYQFEAIHPFTDGNGRTGRIMNVLMLCDAGLLSLPVLYLSRHIIETKDEYYHLLEAVTSDGAWEDWITYLVSGVEETARRSLTIVDGITTVQHTLMTTIRTAVGSANHDVLAVLMEQPYVRARDIMRRCAVTRQTASRWLHVLEDAGVLSHVKVGREVLFVNLPLMAVLRGTTRG
jgi:Fic family protein